MDLNNIPSNSLKSRALKDVESAAPEKLSSVVKAGSAKVKKQSSISKAAKNIISEDAQNVKSYILMDVLIPAFKKAVSDVVTNGIDIVLYGEAGHTKRTNNAGRVSYRGYYDGASNRTASAPKEDTSYRRGNAALFDDIIVDSRGEAEEILSRMGEYLEIYPCISAANMYDLAGITNFPYTYNNYGWKSVATARVKRVADGFLIMMPSLTPLK